MAVIIREKKRTRVFFSTRVHSIIFGYSPTAHVISGKLTIGSDTSAFNPFLQPHCEYIPDMRESCSASIIYITPFLFLSILLCRG